MLGERGGYGSGFGARWRSQKNGESLSGPKICDTISLEPHSDTQLQPSFPTSAQQACNRLANSEAVGALLANG